MEAPSSSVATPNAQCGQGRKRKGRIGKKRIGILKNPKILAFKGWEAEPEPWSFATCVRFVEWCHIDKLFPLYRHDIHRAHNKANLPGCYNELFKRRCVYVWRLIYCENQLFKNEVPYYLARMVYAETILGKRVDWSSLKRLPVGVNPEPGEVGETSPTFEDDGIGAVRGSSKAKADEDVTWSSDSSEDEHTYEYELHEPTSNLTSRIEGDMLEACPVRAVGGPLPDNRDDWMQFLNETSFNTDNEVPTKTGGDFQTFFVDMLKDAIDDVHSTELTLDTTNVEALNVGLDVPNEEFVENPSGVDKEVEERVELMMLRMQIHSEEVKLKIVMESVKKLQALKERAHLPPQPTDFQDDCRYVLEEIPDLISFMEAWIVRQTETRETFDHKKQSNNLSIEDYEEVWTRKLDCMEAMLRDKERTLFTISERLQDVEECNDREVEKEMLQIRDLAFAGKYGKTPEEVNKLKRVLKWNEDHNMELAKQLRLAQEDARFEDAWAEWARRKKDVEGEIRMDDIDTDLEPQRSDFSKGKEKVEHL